MLKIVEESEWAKESLPKLQKNENLWTLIIDLANGDEALDSFLRQEYTGLMQDPDIVDFIRSTAKDLTALAQTLNAADGQTEGKAEQQETTSEEVVP